MHIDPDLGAVLLAVTAGAGLTFLSRRRRVCEACGRRVKSVLCACAEVASETIDAVEERVAASQRNRELG